ncbi:MAG: invasion associated locus B family protein [Alphaproteobacteria bacterium]
MIRFATALLAVLPLLPAAVPAAHAQGRPAAREVRYDDWRQTCETRQAGAAPTCFIEQRVSRDNEPERLLVAVAIGWFAPDGKPGMIVKLPPNAQREAGVIIQVDEKPIREVGIRGCGADNCTVVALVDDGLLTELRAGKRVTIAYARGEDGEVVAVPVSLRGISKGLAALRRK